MITSGAVTILFKEIFPDFENWKEWSQTVLTTYDETFDAFCYTLLDRQFATSNIRYSTVYEFLNGLANVYNNKFDAFRKEKELVDKIYNITSDELLQLNETLVNIANNPNEIVDNVKSPLNYISNQTYSINNNNKLRAYSEALANIPSLNIYRFINESDNFGMSFKDLFMKVIPIEIKLI